MHHVLHPDDGVCKCDEYRGWWWTRKPWTCQCFNTYLTTEGECTNCSDKFPGCTRCDWMGDLNSEFPLAFSAVYNPLMNYIRSGKYMCASCGDSEEFFNHETNKCQRCDSRIPGCTSCSKDGEYYCTKCEHGYHLTDDGSCYDCLHRDNKCDRCTESKCLDCRPGWTLFFDADYCIPDLF